MNSAWWLASQTGDATSLCQSAAVAGLSKVYSVLAQGTVKAPSGTSVLHEDRGKIFIP